VNLAAGRIEVCLDIVPDDYEPYALLSATGADGEQLAQVRVDSGFKLSLASATAWIESDFARPAC
jgi:hypothetical protein